MGLIITNEVYSDSGTTSEAYVNIKKYEYVKDTNLKLHVNAYISLEERENNKDNTIKSKLIPQRVDFSNYKAGSPVMENGEPVKEEEEKPSELVKLTDENLYQVSYSKLKEYLESNGLTVKDSL